MGMLDGLFADPRLPQDGSDQPYGGYTMGGAPAVDDYSGPVPVRRPETKDLDKELKKFQETHPLTPQNAAAAAPAMPGSGQGILTPEMSGPFSAVNAAPPAAPASPVPLPVARNTTNAPGAPGGPPAPNNNSSAPERASDFSSAQRPVTGSPAEGAIDLTDASPGMLGKVWKGIQDNSNLLMGMGAGMSGAPSWAVGMGRGFAGASAGAQADYKQNLQTGSAQQLYQALVAAGVPRQQAIAATTNPKLADTLMQSYIADRKREIKVVHDSLGNERIVSVNPYMSQEELDRANNEGGSRNGGAGDAATLGGPADTSGLARMPIEIDPTTGRDEKFAEAFKKADPISYTATENLINGNMTGTGRNLQSLMKYASRIDPTFNQATFTGRQGLYKSYYGGGEGFKQLRSANTATQHGMDLDQDIDDLHNFSVMPGFLNPVTGAVANQFSKRYQDALSKFRADKAIYAHELEVALTGKSTVSGTKEINDLFDEDKAPGSNKSALRTTLRDLGQRVDEHEAAYNRGMGGKASASPVKDFMTNREKLNRLISGEREAAPAAAPASGVAGPKKIQWNVVQ